MERRRERTKGTTQRSRGDTHSARQVITFYDQTRRELPPTLWIDWVLADSGFGEEAFLEHLEGLGHRYAVALRLTAYVLSAIRSIQVWKELEKGLEVAEVAVALSTWKRARRLIVIRQHVPTRPKAGGKQPMLFRELEERREYRYSVLVTNSTELAPEEIWRTYRSRSNEENCIKELKHGYGWYEFNVRSFWGTEAAMLPIGMVCYNLVHHLNRRVLKTAEESVARLKTLRLKVLAIPAVYGSAGRLAARLAEALAAGLDDGIGGVELHVTEKNGNDHRPNFIAGLDPLFAVPFDHRVHHTHEGRVGVRHLGRCRRPNLAQMPFDDLLDLLRREVWPTAQNLIENHAQRVDVAAMIFADLQAPFGGDEQRSAETPCHPARPRPPRAPCTTRSPRSCRTPARR
ncbi:MAG: transposase [Verrucomicrobiota bacterium]|nr:transposase [Verrucomicrobiota bacterium]